MISYNIMLIEKNKIIADKIISHLSKKGFTIELADIGYKVEKLLLSFQPELIILRLEMPRLSGEILVRKFRGDKDYEDIPIILLADHISKLTLIEMQKDRINDILLRPLNMDKLLTTVEKYYRKKVVEEMSKID